MLVSPPSEHRMPIREEPARGIIIPFPAAAIRRPPTPAFVTQSARPQRAYARSRTALWLALSSLAALLVAGLALRGLAWSSERHGEIPSGQPRSPGSTPTAPQPHLRGVVPGSVNLLIAG